MCMIEFDVKCVPPCCAAPAGNVMIKSSIWWAASPRCLPARRRPSCVTERMTSASCTPHARTALSCGWALLRSLTTVQTHTCTHMYLYTQAHIHVYIIEHLNLQVKSSNYYEGDVIQEISKPSSTMECVYMHMFPWNQPRCAYTCTSVSYPRIPHGSAQVQAMIPVAR